MTDSLSMEEFASLREVSKAMRNLKSTIALGTPGWTRLRGLTARELSLTASVFGAWERANSHVRPPSTLIAQAGNRFSM